MGGIAHTIELPDQLNLISGKGRTVTRTAKLFTFVLLAGASIAVAQSAAGNPPAADPASTNPVASVRNAKSWEYGPFVNGGFGVGDRSSYKFLWAGFQAGKPISSVLHVGILSGQFELAGNIMPLWQAYTPAPHTAVFTCSAPGGGTVPCTLNVGGGTYRGASITPVIFRWNFLTKSSRIQPWAQAAGGLVYTTHKFPPNFQSKQTINGQVVNLDGGTSVWNFTPQGGFGLHYFTRDRRSIDLGVNAVHISSASLGDRNPGVNACFQIQLGYTFWK
jgi:hypothetical protein